MKRKTIIIISCVLALAVIAAGGTYWHVTNLPEYTLNKMLDKVNREGIEAIEPYLSEHLRKPFRSIVDTLNNPFVKLLGNYLAGSETNEQITELLKCASSLEWELQDIQHGSNIASFVLGVKGNSVSGNIDLEMKRIDGKWLVDNVSVPIMNWI